MAILHEVTVVSASSTEDCHAAGSGQAQAMLTHSTAH